MRDADAASQVLCREGIGPGERVVVLAGHGRVQAAWTLAVMSVGAVAVPVASRAKSRQIAHVISDAEPTLLVVEEALRVTVAGVDELLVSAVSDGARVVDAALEGQPAGGPEPGPEPRRQDAAILFYTSGSTGRPKAIVQSHGSLVDGARIVSSYLDLERADIVLSVLPLSFDYGLSQVLVSLHVGCALDFRTYLSIHDLVGAIELNGATVLAGVPTLWNALADALISKDGLSERVGSLRVITNSGGRLPVSTIETLRRGIPGASIHSMYGLSEAFRSTTLDPSEVDRRPGSIGKAIPEVEVVVLREDGSPVDPGEVGELVHCGALVANGYWRRPEDTDCVFRPDPRPDAESGAVAVWSGDLVRRDAEGFLEFLGRKDLQVKIRGMRVSVEEVLDVVRDVEGVRDCAGFGVAGDETADAELVVVVEPGDQSDVDAVTASVRKACRRELPQHLIPARIESVEKLPRTPHGKIDTVRARRESEDRRAVRRDLLAILERYSARYPLERETADRIAQLVASHDDFLFRSCVPGHITASAWIVDSAGARYMLLHHRKLGRWLQPGGHVDGQHPSAAVLREAEEETGITGFEFLGPFGVGGEPLPFDLDVHTIPARPGEPAHEHHDVRYLLRAPTGAEPVVAEREAHAVAWFDASSPKPLAGEESLLRMWRKANGEVSAGNSHRDER